MRIGIVGSGIAGLYGAYRLQKAGHSVTLLEYHSRIGMGAHTEHFEPSGVWGDVPSRMLNPLLWPRLFRLYAELAIDVVPVDPSQSFLDGEGNSYLRMNVAYRPQNLLPKLFFGQTRRILLDARRLLSDGPQQIDELPRTLSFGEFLVDENYSSDFRYGFLYPTLSSTVCTCSYEALDQYPAVVLLRALQRLTAAGMEEHRDTPLLWRVRGGTESVVQKLAEPLSDIRLGCVVESVVPGPEKVELAFRDGDGAVHERAFDHVLVASRANSASRFLPAITPAEEEMLGSFSYERIFVTVHRDTECMPNQKKDWATFNQKLVGDSNGGAACTVWMNRFHDWPSDAPDVFQTISTERLDFQNIERDLQFQRPFVSQTSFSGWEQREQLHADVGRRIWFIGSYASPGVPLLETGIESVDQLPLLRSPLSIA